MFLFNLQALLVFIAVFSLPALLLELQLLVIGLDGMTPSVMLFTFILGVVSGIGALVIEMIDG